MLGGPEVAELKPAQPAWVGGMGCAGFRSGSAEEPDNLQLAACRLPGGRLLGGCAIPVPQPAKPHGLCWLWLGTAEQPEMLSL